MRSCRRRLRRFRFRRRRCHFRGLSGQLDGRGVWWWIKWNRDDLYVELLIAEQTV
jgi:hypothetical protein